jgi:hypothetical protein
MGSLQAENSLRSGGQMRQWFAVWHGAGDLPAVRRDADMMALTMCSVLLAGAESRRGGWSRSVAALWGVVAAAAGLIIAAAKWVVTA